ncbi:hypothetical protein AB7315_21510 [Providencia manganoxydans]|uniref:Rz1-like lysis system protein LysC n=1 Tax=Providencia TaxID=586 RepID=UPI00298E6641|nr:hypothetical protein [Providencia sp. 2023EL-00965]MDW7587523.1 hypothetical protein [Providencia sp. 2023EL-00965]
MHGLKAYFRDSVGMLASVAVLSVGIYLFSENYFLSRGGEVSYLLYFASAISFLAMTAIAFALVISDAVKLYAQMHVRKMKCILILAVFVNIFGFIGMFIVSAKNVNQATEYVLAQYIPIPPSLVSDCQIPEVPNEMTWGELAEYNIELMSVIKACNLDKKAIREIEQQRASQ